MALSLAASQHPLASPQEQLRILDSGECGVKRFDDALFEAGMDPLAAAGISVLQINTGKLCNQTCKHCHVDAGPDRTAENMSRATFELCLRAIRQIGRPVVDLTGGAPELNPHFRWFVKRVRELKCHVIDRCNLTVLLLAPQRGLAEFLAEHRVEVIASLPYYLAQRTDAQRGDGVFGKSLVALRKLNALGYGVPGSGLELNLVYNPTGAFLPPNQAALEADFRHELRSRYDVEFNSLYTITNMPISRYLEFLIASGNFRRYMERLANAFNPVAATGVMCRTTLSVGWDGTLYDCDFNQMLELEVSNAVPRHIRDFELAKFAARRVVTGQHCYGCTAGTGSSCGGATV